MQRRRMHLRPLSHRASKSATRTATPKLPALRTRGSHKRFKPQLARVILLRKNLNQLKRTGLVVKHEM